MSISNLKMDRENINGCRKTDSQKLFEKFLIEINSGNLYLPDNGQEEHHNANAPDNNAPFCNVNDVVTFKDLVPSEEQKRAFEATNVYATDYIAEDIFDADWRRSPETVTLSPTSTDSDISNLSLYLVWGRTGANYDPAHLTDEGIYLEDNYLNESSSDEELIEGIRNLNITPTDIDELPPEEDPAFHYVPRPKRQNEEYHDDDDRSTVNPIKKTKMDF